MFFDGSVPRTSLLDDGFVVQVLVRSFVVVVRQIFAQQHFQVSLRENKEMIEAFLANGANNAFQICVQVG